MCRSVDAREALRLGLVNFVLPKAELDAHVQGAPPRVCVRMCMCMSCVCVLGTSAGPSPDFDP